MDFSFDFNLKDAAYKQIVQTEIDAKNVMQATINEVGKRTKDRCPVKKGKLKKGIKKKVKKDENDNISGSVYVDKSVFYAPWVNNGSERTKAQHFMPEAEELKEVLEKKGKTGFKSI